MTSLDNAKNNPELAFWDETEKVHSVMLGADGAGSHMQPMAPMVDTGSKAIWFFTSKDSDLAQAVVRESLGKMCVVNSDNGFYACATGSIVTAMDKKVVEKFWSPIVEAWFPGGKNDESLILLKFKLHDLSIWKSSGSALKFGWEIAKANLTDEQPDIGFQTNIKIAS